MKKALKVATLGVAVVLAAFIALLTVLQIEHQLEEYQCCRYDD